MKKTLFISDLHLDASHKSMAETFVRFLKSADVDVDAVYILGDLFETWIGDDDKTHFNQSMITAIQSTTRRGIPIYILHGNRDFLLGNHFLAATGCQLLPDESVINVYNTPVLLMHGDTLCTLDLTYLKSRRWMRNRVIQRLFLCLPLTLRRKLANSMRKKSQQHVTTTPMQIMDVTHAEVKNVMNKHHVLHLIHGHTHRLAMHQFELDNMPALRIVLGAWHQSGSVLTWREDGEKILIDI